MLGRLVSLMLALLTLGQGALDAYVEEMNLGGNLFLVNRTFSISSSYVPPDLVIPKVKGANRNVRMRREAAEALEKLFQAAKDESGFELIAISGYRSYGKQKAIFERNVAQKGRKAALRFSAPPGCSEHQLGLAMDLGCKGSASLTGGFGQTLEGVWVRENCHRFGFIIRYKAEWEDVTGYMDEPWHIRYVGVEHAARIRQADIPLEHYIAQLRQARLSLLNEKEGFPSND